MNKFDRRWIWIILAVFTVLLRVILGNFPEVVEQYYSRGLFLGVRSVLDYSIGLLPFPMLYILILGLICFVIYRIFLKKRKKKPLKYRIINFIFNLVTVLFAIVFLFLFLWGFNYSRIPIEKQLSIQPQPLSKAAIQSEFLSSTEDLLTAYSFVAHYDETDIKTSIFTDEMELAVRTEVRNTFRALGYPVPGRLRARYLYPKGSLLRISTAGFYLPLTGECHIDPGLHPLQIPYVMSHELAHGFGIGDEGSCNFIAYLSCRNSKDPLRKYAGMLSYWRSVASQYRRVDPTNYKEVRASLPKGILMHMKKINEEMDKYPDIFPAVRDATYNAYLKTQGIEEGIKNYSRVVLLVQAYRNK